MNTVAQEQLDLLDTPHTFIRMCLARSMRRFKTAPELQYDFCQQRHKTGPEGGNSDVDVRLRPSGTATCNSTYVNIDSMEVCLACICRCMSIPIMCT